MRKIRDYYICDKCKKEIDNVLDKSKELKGELNE